MASREIPGLGRLHLLLRGGRAGRPAPGRRAERWGAGRAWGVVSEAGSAAGALVAAAAAATAGGEGARGEEVKGGERRGEALPPPALGEPFCQRRKWPRGGLAASGVGGAGGASAASPTPAGAGRGGRSWAPRSPRSRRRRRKRAEGHGGRPHGGGRARPRLGRPAGLIPPPRSEPAAGPGRGGEQDRDFCTRGGAGPGERRFPSPSPRPPGGRGPTSPPPDPRRSSVAAPPSFPAGLRGAGAASPARRVLCQAKERVRVVGPGPRRRHGPGRAGLGLCRRGCNVCAPAAAGGAEDGCQTCRLTCVNSRYFNILGFSVSSYIFFRILYIL